MGFLVTYKKKNTGNNSPAFNAALTSTLVPEKGSGVATFTRATTATVTDFEGLIRVVKSGEVRFDGARRVENLFTATDTLSTQGVTTAGGTNAYVVSFTGSGTITFSGTYVGSLVGSDGVRKSILITTTAGTLTCTVSGSVTFAQCELVLGQSNSNPSEYVSKGTLSSPYHGAGVDGVKYLTAQNGNTVSSNVVTEATGASISETTLKGVEIEVASTNFQIQSQNHSLGTSWTLANSTIVANQTTNIDGSLTGSALTEVAGANARVGAIYCFVITSAVISTVTYYVKPKTNDRWVRLSVGSSGLDFVYVTVNPATGAITQAATKNAAGSATAYSGTCEIITGGVCKITLTFDWGVSKNLYTTLIMSDVATPAEGVDYGHIARTGNGTSGIYILASQFEKLPMATSYIPTTTATVTRNADVLTYPNLGNVLDAKGTVYMEATPAFNIPTGTVAGYGENFLIDFGTNGKGFISVLNRAVRRTDGTTYPQSPAWTPLKNVAYKIGSRYGSIGQKNYLDGTAGTNGAFDGSINSGTNMTIGGYGGNTIYSWGGNIKNLKIWKKELSDAYIAGL